MHVHKHVDAQGGCTQECVFASRSSVYTHLSGIRVQRFLLSANADWPSSSQRLIIGSAAQQHYEHSSSFCLRSSSLQPLELLDSQVRFFFASPAGSDTDSSARQLLATQQAFAFGCCGGMMSGLPDASDNAQLPCPTNYGCRRNSQNYWQCFPGAAVVQPYTAPVPSPPPPPPPPPTPLPSSTTNRQNTGKLTSQLWLAASFYGQPHLIVESQAACVP